jgi:hypothetical protein
MAKIKQGKKDVDSYTIRGTTKVVRGTFHHAPLPSPPVPPAEKSDRNVPRFEQWATPC